MSYQIARRKKFITLLAIISGIVLISVYVNVVIGREIVYTHLFYLPIILAGLWYYRKALYIALFLGLFHIGINFYAEGMFVSSTLFRSGILCVIAYIIGFLSEKKDRYWADLRQTQESLYLSEERFRCLADNAPDIIYRLQLSPVQYLSVSRVLHEIKYDYVSPAVTAITGYTPEDFYADPGFIRRITHPGDLAQVEKILNGGISSSGPVVMRWYHKDGRVLWMEHKRVLICDSNHNIVALEGMVRDITSRVQMEEELKAKYEEIRVLSGHILHAYEEERTRLARELHDEIGQALTVVNLDLQYLQIQLSQAEPSCRAKLSASINLLGETLENVRRQIMALRPPALDNMGLIEVVHDMAHDLENRSGLTIEFHARGFSGRLPADMETALYRCIQEALTNAARHAAATKVSIHLSLDGDKVSALIEDNGRGFDPKEIALYSRGVGLAGIRERVHLMGGSLRINAAPGAGVKISIVVPFMKEELSGNKP